MKSSSKAALLSALVFPGAGQISAGHNRRGWIIIAATITVMSLLIRGALQKAQQIIEQMQKSGVVMDMESISKAAAQASGFSDNLFLNILLISLIIIWLFSVLDAYRLAQNKQVEK